MDGYGKLSMSGAYYDRPARSYVQPGFFYKCVLKNKSVDIDETGNKLESRKLALSSRVQVVNLPPLFLPFEKDEFFLGRVSYVGDPLECFVQLENNAQLILAITRMITDYCEKEKECVCNPAIGTIIIAKYQADNCFYRASVLAKVGYDTILVFFVDYGNIGVVTMDDAFVLENVDLLSIPPQAILLRINKVTADDVKVTQRQLSDLISDQRVGAHILDVADNDEAFMTELVVKDEKGKEVSLKEVLLGERPAPVIPPPKPIRISENFNLKNYVFRSENANVFSNFCTPSDSYEKKEKHQMREPPEDSFRNEKQSQRGENNFRTGSKMNDENSRETYRGGFNENEKRRMRGLPEDISRGDRPSRAWGSDFRKESKAGDENYGEMYNGGFNENGARIASRNFSDASGSAQVCYNCGKSGHVSRYCSEQRRNEGNRGARNFARPGQMSRGFGQQDEKQNQSDQNFTRRNWGGSVGTTQGFGQNQDKKLGSQRSLYSERSGRSYNNDSGFDIKSGWKSDNLTAHGKCVGKESINLIADDGNEGTDNVVRNGLSGKNGVLESDTTNEWNVNLGGWEITSASDSTESKSVSSQKKYGLNLETTEKGCGAKLINAFGVQLDSNTVTLARGSISDVKQSLEEATGMISAEVVAVNQIAFDKIDELKYGEVMRGKRPYSTDLLNPTSFFVRLEKNEDIVNKLSLRKLPNGLPKLNSFKSSQACMALFSEDYYRAEIIEKVEDGKYSVLFVDYGNTDVVNESELFAINSTLPDIFCNSPRMGLHCRLCDIVPPNEARIFDEETCREFAKLTEEKELQITIMQLSKKNVYEITIRLNDGRFISDVLCTRGLANVFDWGIGPPLSTYEVYQCFRSDETESVEHIFSVHLEKYVVIVERLSETLVSSLETVKVPRLNDAVIAHFDGCPYRAQIIGVEDGERRYRLRFVDFGNESVCEKSEIFAIDRDEQPKDVIFTPRQSVRCQLEGVTALNSEGQNLLNKFLNSSCSFSAVFGSPNSNGIYPIKILVPEEKLSEQGSREMYDEEKKISLSKLFVLKNFADVDQQNHDYPVENLIASGRCNYGAMITDVHDQFIFTRPCNNQNLYSKMTEVLFNIKVDKVKIKSHSGLVEVDGSYKRASIVDFHPDFSSFEDKSDINGASKCFLVDDGRVLEDVDVFRFSNVFYDDNDFFIRTCYRLSMQFRFNDIIIKRSAKKIILDNVGDNPVTVHIFSYKAKEGYRVKDVILSDGRSLKAILIESGSAVLVEQSDDGELLSTTSKSFINTSVQQSENGISKEKMPVEKQQNDETEAKCNAIISENELPPANGETAKSEPSRSSDSFSSQQCAVRENHGMNCVVDDRQILNEGMCSLGRGDSAERGTTTTVTETIMITESGVFDELDDNGCNLSDPEVDILIDEIISCVSASKIV